MKVEVVCVVVCEQLDFLHSNSQAKDCDFFGKLFTQESQESMSYFGLERQLHNWTRKSKTVRPACLPLVEL